MVSRALKNVANTTSDALWHDWESFHLLSKIKSVHLSWQWQDQGWGNHQGKVRILLERCGSVIHQEEIGVAGHQSTDVNVEFTSSPVIEESASDDTLKLQYFVGGGGGHQLFIRNGEISLHSHNRQKILEDMAELYPEETFETVRKLHLKNIADYNSVSVWMAWETIQVHAPISKIRARWDWVDQGAGNRQGKARLSLVRSGKEIVTEQLGNVAEHSKRTVRIILEDGPIIEQACCGDTLLFEYFVGGGGGHSLTITDGTCKIYYQSRNKSATK